VLAALAIDREAVRQQRAIGCAVFERAAQQQRRVEPAAVLVVAFKVDVGLGALLVIAPVAGRAGVRAAQHVEEGAA